jgi:hypothetical protein
MKSAFKVIGETKKENPRPQSQQSRYSAFKPVPSPKNFLELNKAALTKPKAP